MNVNRKFDRFKQWGRERMGGEVKTNLSDDFKAMETEMNVRHDGVDRIHKAMTAYVKHISKRSEGDDKEKTLPIAHLGASMVSHGEDFDANSEYGRGLTMMGRTEERLARVQESYITQATSSWLESLERSLTQMKDYQTARKKLDNRRLAYDSSLSKMQKVKKEDFRVEEELRTQKFKYEEANEDVYRRMGDIKDAEIEHVTDLEAFLEAQLDYHERCREVLLQLKTDWRGGQSTAHSSPSGRRVGRTRSNTAHSFQDRYEPVQEEYSNGTDPRPIIRSSQPPSSAMDGSPRDVYTPDVTPSRPVFKRTSTFEGPTQLRQESSQSQAPQNGLARAFSENLMSQRETVPLRPVSRVPSDPYVDPPQESSYCRENGSPERSYYGRSVSPASSYGASSYGGASRKASSSNLSAANGGNGLSKKGPPPPPPSRAKKPPPPPPPMKRVIQA